MAKVIVLLSLTSFWFLGCQTQIGQPTAESICTKPGVVTQETIDAPSRGYSYSYFIYLPPCYDRDVAHTYPVLYLLPGRGSGPGSWFAAGANDVADALILSGKIAPFVIVSTENTDSDQLAETIYNDLMPHIESSYRVKAERPFQAVAGGSLGSIGAYRLAFQYPDQFASVGMFGGGLIHGEEEQAAAWLTDMAEAERPRLFLNTGEQDPLMLERAKVMIEMLDTYQIDHTELFTPGEHTYGYWVSNLPTYFEWLAQDWE
ncbi:MAG: hypothetical protein IAF02_06965 [Anaerolineae bacterium]|nr:hypothetical protein [Anaerolineae bacterium]